MIKFNNSFKKYLIFVLLFSFNSAIAQQKVLLLDGKTIQTSQIKEVDSLSLYFYLTPKNKERMIEKDFIYSLTNDKGEETIIYKPQFTDNKIGIPQMKAYILGEQYVYSNYKPYGAAISGLAVGAASSISFPYMGINVFYSSFVSLGYLGLQSMVKHKVKIMNVPANSQYPEFYKKGFRNRAVKKRFVYTIVGSLIGTGIGFGVNAYKMNH